MYFTKKKSTCDFHMEMHANFLITLHTFAVFMKMHVIHVEGKLKRNYRQTLVVAQRQLMLLMSIIVKDFTHRKDYTNTIMLYP